MARTHLTRAITGLAGVLIALTVMNPTGSAHAATAPSWSLPVPTTTTSPFARQATLTAITCADAEDCFAGAVGQSLTGTTYATADGGAQWGLQRAADTVGGGPVACAPEAVTGNPFCVAIAGSSVENLSLPGSPVTGPANDVPQLELAAAIACPSAGLCVAVGGTGGTTGSENDIITSTSPLTGDWTAAVVGGGIDRLDAISCPSTSLCVAVDPGGVWVSTDPAGGPGTFTRTGLGGPGMMSQLLDTVSCSSAQLCVIGGAGATFVSTDPAGGDWTPVTLPGNATGLTGISCPADSFCALSDPSGQVFASTDPAGGVFTQVASLPAGLGPVSCASSTACEVLDGANVISTTSPLAGTAAWQATPVYAWTPLTAVSCPSSGLCVALAQDGRADATTTPLDAGASWSVSAADPVGTPVAISCPTTSACFGVDASGRVLWSTAPASGGWHQVHVDTQATPVAISCPTATFCAFADAGGYLFTSTDPTGGTGAWKRVRRTVPKRVRTDIETLTALTCTSLHFCLATDSGGWIYTSTDPRGDAGTWRATQIWKRLSTSDAFLVKAACSTSSDCVVMATYAGGLKASDYDPDALGTYALTSTDPTGGARRWSARHIDGGYVESDASTNDAGRATGLSCPTTRLCAMVDDLGTAVTNPGVASASNWQEASIDALATPDMSDGSPGLTGVSCFAGGHCVAIDAFGNRFAFGIGAGPVQPAPGVTFGG